MCVPWAAPPTASAAWIWTRATTSSAWRSRRKRCRRSGPTVLARNEKPEAELPPPNLILSVTENGYGKRTAVDEYRLQSRGGKGVINVKTTARNGKVVAIMLVSEESEAMLISQYGKIIRMDTGTIREAGRSTQGVRLLSMEGGDKVAAAVVIPPEETNGNGNGTPPLIQ